MHLTGCVRREYPLVSTLALILIFMVVQHVYVLFIEQVHAVVYVFPQRILVYLVVPLLVLDDSQTGTVF